MQFQVKASIHKTNTKYVYFILSFVLYNCILNFCYWYQYFLLLKGNRTFGYVYMNFCLNTLIKIVYGTLNWHFGIIWPKNVLVSLYYFLRYTSTLFKGLKAAPMLHSLVFQYLATAQIWQPTQKCYNLKHKAHLWFGKWHPFPSPKQKINRFDCEANFEW